MPIIQNNVKKQTFNKFPKELFLCLFMTVFLYNCQSPPPEGPWDYKILFSEDTAEGVMKLKKLDGAYQLNLVSLDRGTTVIKDIDLASDKLSARFELFGESALLKGTFSDGEFKGNLSLDEEVFAFVATKQSYAVISIDRSNLKYILSEGDLPAMEKNIDHAGILADTDRESFKRGERIYSSNCINCHGNQDVEGSIPLSTKFWEQSFKAGSDVFSMYQTVTRGYGYMPPQPALTPQDKYDVITYIQQKFLRDNSNELLIQNSPGYRSGLPKGSSRGPKSKPYQPWADMDYGNFLINTYELADEVTGPERYHSPGPSPYPDEDYSKNNFAYKGIAIRLDKGKGGVSKGKAWMIFDHDLMRIAGGWTGTGFIDWNGILLNDKHETYPRTIGKLHFKTPVGPGWANPVTGSFEDPRFRARDGRAFGPLPKPWAHYKGLYHYEDHVVLSYTVGSANILEELGMEILEAATVFTRTLNISASSALLKMKVAPKGIKVALMGEGARLSEEDGFIMMIIDREIEAKVKLLISGVEEIDLTELSSSSPAPDSLSKYCHGGGNSHFPEILNTIITTSMDKGTFAVDQLTPPFDNPWACRMKLSGIDFMADSNKAVVCTTDGDIWLITGLADHSETLNWQRIGSGLFQPLGIKVLNDDIYVICRDQLVLLEDYDKDGETDFYKSFNNDHQVTDHFHEFAMGLQADKEGNLYYAKSGRHAREALVPQHGTLLKVSNDGTKTDIIATGFRAANGVCINPDGSFLVTDQQGFWNPMNRINWVEGEGKFYGNMWGYNPPKDTTRLAMEQPMVWVDMMFDRSPSELLWVESTKWGPLNGSLLSFSYGFGKIQLVLHEKVNGQVQGGVIDLPGIKFLTGVMRGRFNPGDGQLYACGMSAWGTNQMLRGGGLYRIRYTGKSLTTPIALKTSTKGVRLTFAAELDPEMATNISNYKIRTWELVRSSAYGSDRYNEKALNISGVEYDASSRSIYLTLQDIQPIDVMTITYDLRDTGGNSLNGTLQNTIHHLTDSP